MSVTSAYAALEDALVARLPDLLGEVRAGLGDRWPDYADFLQSDETDVLEAARMFARGLVKVSSREHDQAGGSDPTGTPVRSRPADQTMHLVFEQIGRRQFQVGNDLTRLLTAFQLGARIAWKHVSAAALETSLAPDSFAALADAVFDFVNQLSFAAARGYLREQADDASARARTREELAALMLSGRGGPEAIRALARRAGWRMPARAAVVLVDPEDEVAHTVLERLDPSTLPIRGERGVRGVIVSDPDGPGRRDALARQLHGARAVVGRVVAPEELARSVELAEIAARLCGAGVLAGDPLFAEEHLDDLIVCRGAQLIALLRAKVLAPLAPLSESALERLTETLVSWLAHHGNHTAVAAELSIHPQTVRYRMGQLHELFGDALEDPRSRARLSLALLWPATPEHSSQK